MAIGFYARGTSVAERQDGSLTRADARLASLGVAPAPAPAAHPTVLPAVTGTALVVSSGQIAAGENGLVAVGRPGAEVDVDTGKTCAAQYAVNLLERVRETAGSLDRSVRIFKVTVFVASSHAFTDQHLVAHGASDLMVEVLGDRGRHARSAIDVAALPLSSPVEVEAIFELQPA